MDLEFIQGLLTPAKTKIVLLVLDGLGGLAREAGGPTELEEASSPNLDRLAAEGVIGLHHPVGAGISPGSGPGHLGLFGYDPVEYQIGRGALEALGIGFDLRDDDVAARGNFCTVDAEGVITDRRAGRIATERARELCSELARIELPGVEVFVEAVGEHRFLLVIRGDALDDGISDTDPGRVGERPRAVVAERENAERAAKLVARFVDEARGVLDGHAPANMITLRGFARIPDWPRFPDAFGLRSAAVAHYPMYRGVASLLGMESFECGPTIEDLILGVREVWHEHDFIFAHVKDTDKAGEDGDFQRKVAAIEMVDAQMPALLELGPDVLLVTGDHSTPAVLRSHSWHPVPVLLWSRNCRSDDTRVFGESACLTGGLGIMRSVELMPLALANALRLTKFGA